jgi:hypothetical protein
MPPRRFRAPTENGAVLADPDCNVLPPLVEHNRNLLDTSHVIIGGLPLRELRTLARREVLQLVDPSGSADTKLAADAPLLLAGHQPELSHPGVWVKHFALNGLARKLNGIPLNLIVDNDRVKQTALRFPVFDRDPAGVHLESLPFDRLGTIQPYETRTINDPECFATFSERAARIWQTWNYEPLLPQVWANVITHPAQTMAERFTAVRQDYERRWGCVNHELPVSRLAKTAAFKRFVSHIVQDAVRFRGCYNAAVQDYRTAHAIKSRSHPVPDLASDELPFWVSHPDTGRHRLTISQTVDADHIRPRALTLTLFARLCLGDFFIHGIGGGKYDEVTDAIIRDYFGLQPPAYQVLSATLYLPLPSFPATAADMQRLKRLERDLYWNPQRYLPADDPARHEHDRLAACDPPDSHGRKARYRAFRMLAADLRPRVADQLAKVRQHLVRAQQEVRANAILRRRDYSWVLYPADLLRPFLQRILGKNNSVA